MALNPIIKRELIGFLRTRWSLAIQVACPLLFSALVLVRWPTDDRADLAGNRSLEVYQLLGFGLLVMLLLLSPALPAVTIVRERIRGTLAQLLNTPMRPWSVYFGKLVGAMGYTLLPIVLSLPAMAACYAMGGVALNRDVIPLYAVLLIASVQIASISLWVSSLSTTSDSALRCAYGVVLLFAVVSLVPYQFLQGRPPGIGLTLARWLRDCSPIAAVMETLGLGGPGAQLLVEDRTFPWRYCFSALLISIVVIVHSIRRLRPMILERSRSQGVVTQERSRSEQWLRRFLFVADPQRRSKPIGDLTNPVLIKEFRTRRFGRSQWLMRMVALAAVISLTLTYFTATGTISWGVETIGALMVLLQAALIAVVTPALGSGLISAERERGNWSLLQMTPLPAHRIVAGKLMSVAWPAMLLLLATLPGYAVMMFIQPVMLPQILRVLATLVLSTSFAVLMSAAVSSLTARSAAATIASYALFAVLWGGTLILWLGRDRPFGHRLVESALTINPIATALSIIKLPGFAEYNLIPINWWLVSSACLLSIVVLTIQTWRLTRPY
jgi:ABC-type transport system involved in multi-copper enzyme maturation permease subunit